MSIETTLHVHKSTLEMLNEKAEKTGRTITSIIKLLMKRIMNDNQKMLKSYSRIKYQERDVKDNWHRLHIILNEDEYEYYQDVRKFYKMSISFILAYAVRRYLNEVVNKLLDRNNFTDKYYFKDYIFVKKTIDGVICWQIYWGIPQKLHTISAWINIHHHYLRCYLLKYILYPFLIS